MTASRVTRATVIPPPISLVLILVVIAHHLIRHLSAARAGNMGDEFPELCLCVAAPCAMLILARALLA